MIIKKEYLFFLLLSVPFISGAQPAPETVSGSVAGEEGGKTTALAGVNVYWEGTTLGTSSNEHGHFVIERTGKTNRLVFSSS